MRACMAAVPSETDDHESIIACAERSAEKTHHRAGSRA
jgi:hypothetical protein